MIDPEIQEIFSNNSAEISPLRSVELEAILSRAARKSEHEKTRRRVLVAGGGALAVAGSVWFFSPPSDPVDVRVAETVLTTATTSTVVGVSPTNIQIPEGLWMSEMLPLIAQQVEGLTEAELRAVLDEEGIVSSYRPSNSDSWEGLLHPGDYRFEGPVRAQDVLAKMSDEFSEVAGELGYEEAESRTGYSPYEVLTIASMIEAENGTGGDRARIARVIYNRLALDVPVGINSTFNYQRQDRELEVTQSVLETDTPYNLRIRTGLPPTPIAAPSRESLEAALNPADGDWIFYLLADADGGYFFTEDSDEFLAQKEKSRELGLLPDAD